MAKLDRDERRQAMIADLKRLAEREGPDITRRTFLERSRWTESQLSGAFRNWGELRIAAGLTRWADRSAVNVKYTHEDLLVALGRAADEFGPTVSRAQFSRLTGISITPVIRLFGSWQALRQAGGFFERNGSGMVPIWSREQVREMIQTMLADRGGELTLFEFCESAGISPETVRRRAGWERTRLELGYARRGGWGWLPEDDPLRPLLPPRGCEMPLVQDAVGWRGRSAVAEAPAGGPGGNGVAPSFGTGASAGAGRPRHPE